MRGTLAGNLVTGSPIGDTAPAMMALGASVEIAGVDGRRSVDVGDFYTGYRQTVLRPGELVTGVRIPLPAAGEAFKLYKVSRRKDLDISGFSAAVWMTLDGRRILKDVRIAFGGVGPMTVRMTAAEGHSARPGGDARSLRGGGRRGAGSGRADHGRPRLGRVPPDIGGQHPAQVLARNLPRRPFAR